jgi:hypothetical protein
MSSNPKSRMVSFRLSADEYEKIRNLSFSQGLGSVSEVARTAIHTLLNNPKAVSSLSLDVRIADLEGRMKIVISDFRKLQSRFGGSERK